MTSESFNRPGAVDLSGMANAAAASANSTGGAHANYVMELDEAGFEQVVGRSMQHPVLLELYSPRAGAEALSQTLAELTNAAGGRWLLARVNVDAQPRIAQALQVSAVPMVVAVIAGQLAPLFQGTKERDEVEQVLGQLSQIAVANGLTGRADPVAGPDGQGADEAPAVDPRFAAADQAMARGDFAAAVAEFEKLLAQTPGDAEASQGLAQAKLLQRSMGFQPEQIVTRANAEPDNIDLQLDAADLELINGDAAASFERILGLIRENREPEVRERLRLRLLELFDVVGKTDPAVLKARRKLSTALFA